MRSTFHIFAVVLFCFASDISSASKDLECGFGRSEFVGYIVGGEPSTRGAWPWLVALIHTENDQFFCSGSLISAKHVLSGEVAT